MPVTVQGPPTSAEPNPVATVRSNTSAATKNGLTPSVTVTFRVAVSVALSSSVTVSVTV